ncbi:1150_t:CDS:2, partial [Ambispora gerdemannii]
AQKDKSKDLSEIDALRELNSKLAECTKLKEVIKQSTRREAEYVKLTKDTTNLKAENAELRARVAKLEQSSNLTCDIKTVTLETNPKDSTEAQDAIIAKSNGLTPFSKIKIPYNQKVEQGLRSELFEFIRSNDPMTLQTSYSTPGKQISGTLFHNKDMICENDLTP